jgi:hypothetical protein
MEKRGEAIGEGARVSYVVVGSADNVVAVPASDPDALEKIDRHYYWSRRVYPPTKRLIEVVYPDEKWGESKPPRRQRRAEEAGQMRLDVDNSPKGRVRTRRKKLKKVVVTLVEDGRTGIDGRRLTLEAIKAAAEAHAGPVPLDVMIKLEKATVKIPTGLGIDPSVAVKRALERVVTKRDEITGL